MHPWKGGEKGKVGGDKLVEKKKKVRNEKMGRVGCVDAHMERKTRGGGGERGN